MARAKVYIDMEIPKSCDECDFARNDMLGNLRCTLGGCKADFVRDFKEDRHPYCTLTEGVCGGWLHTTKGVKCSVCGATFPRSADVEPLEFCFCPHCGADMRGEQDG